MITSLFVLVSGGLVLVGLAIVAAGVNAYAKTEQSGLLHLSVGFTLIVGATIATAVSALATDFSNAGSLLVVNNGFSMAGYALVAYSIVSYE